MALDVTLSNALPADRNEEDRVPAPSQNSLRLFAHLVCPAAVKLTKEVQQQVPKGISFRNR